MSHPPDRHLDLGVLDLADHPVVADPDAHHACRSTGERTASGWAGVGSHCRHRRHDPAAGLLVELAKLPNGRSRAFDLVRHKSVVTELGEHVVVRDPWFGSGQCLSCRREAGFVLCRLESPEIVHGDDGGNRSAVGTLPEAPGRIEPILPLPSTSWTGKQGGG
jgi:hypothetical protein